MTIWAPMEIDASGLASLVRHARASTIIVDCRCMNEFNACHVKSAINAFFAKLMRKRLVENRLCDSVLLDQLSSADQGTRMHTEKLDIVLYSDEEKAPKCNLKRRIASLNSPDNPSKMLKVLREQLINTNKFKNIMILEGGFKTFQTAFPQLCEGSSEAMSRLQPSLSQPCLSSTPDSDGPTQIFPFLFLGSQHDALDLESMKKNGISYVINLSMTCPKVVDDEHFLRIPVNDGYQDKLTPHFEDAWEFLEKVRKSGNTVLIHCLAGISRSPTLAISYVMRHKKVSSEHAYKFVKDRRPNISPNFNFMGQLLEYEQQLISRDILPPEASSKKHSYGPLTEKQDETIYGTAKVPKSASSHCVMMPSSYEPVCKSSFRLNENGKRGLEIPPDATVPDRPRALGLSLKPRRILPEDLPSPSSEMQKLNFGVVQASTADFPSPAQDYPTSLANPCFFSPGTPADGPEEVLPGKEPSAGMSFFNRVPNFFNNKKQRAAYGGPTSRPDCLLSAGVQLPPVARKSSTTLKSPTLLSTTAEEDPDAESPESGFQDEFKTSPDESDRVSLSSQSSMEIAVQ